MPRKLRFGPFRIISLVVMRWRPFRWENCQVTAAQRGVKLDRSPASIAGVACRV